MQAGSAFLQSERTDQCVTAALRRTHWLNETGLLDWSLYLWKADWERWQAQEEKIKILKDGLWNSRCFRQMVLVHEVVSWGDGLLKMPTHENELNYIAELCPEQMYTSFLKKWSKSNSRSKHSLVSDSLYYCNSQCRIWVINKCWYRCLC